jgi:hypothetical protein
MPIPDGFKVNGSKSGASRIPISPRVRKIIDILNSLPANELLTTMEVSARLGLSLSGNYTNQPSLVDYREKVDNKLFWGNRKSIAQLREQLAEPEETQNENQ